MPLDRAILIDQLLSLPEEQLVAILREVFALRQPAPEEAAYCRNRYFLGTAWSDLESDEGDPERGSAWQIHAVAYPDPDVYGHDLGPDYGLAQEGSCQNCGTTVRSNVKEGICPICDSKVYMT